MLADKVGTGAVTRAMLSAEVLSDLNQSIEVITREMLPASVLGDLNRRPMLCSVGCPRRPQPHSHSANDSVLLDHHRPVERADIKVFKAGNYGIPTGSRTDLQRAEYEPDLAGTGEVPDLPVATQWPTDCGSNAGEFQHRGCERFSARRELQCGGE